MATPFKEAALALPSIQTLWPFGEPSGTEAIEAKNGLTGTYSGSLTLGQKSLLPNGEGTSAHFTGGKMEKGDTEKLRLGAGAMSIFAWFNADSLAAANYSLWDNTNRGYSQFLNTNAEHEWFTFFGTASKTENVFTLLKETIYFVVLTSTGTKVIYYVNGVNKKEDATFTAGATNSNAGVAFAGNPSGGGTVFQGFGQYFGICNAALSQATVEALYASGSQSTGGGGQFPLSRRNRIVNP